jgi:hypothetical protein
MRALRFLLSLHAQEHVLKRKEFEYDSPSEGCKVAAEPAFADKHGWTQDMAGHPERNPSVCFM